MSSMAIVTLTTDFGYSDGYVGAVKGVVLAIEPSAQVVDLCHGVIPYDLLDGAYILAQAYAYYPPGTIHVVVVDPGVGTARRAIVAHVGRHYFVAPDNGVLSLVYARESECTVYHATASHYFAAEVSSTFQGRDIFAPLAGWLAKGVEAEKFGEPIADFVRFALPKPRAEADGVHGVVLKSDRFGNVITNFTTQDLPQLAAADGAAPPFELTLGQAKITSLRASYGDAPPNQLFAVWGSAGFLEISANRGSALRLAAAERGAEAVFRAGS